MTRRQHARIDHTVKPPTPGPSRQLDTDFQLHPNTPAEVRAVQLRCAEHALPDRNLLVELLDELGLK